MEIEDLKRVWTKVNQDSGQPVYSVEDIAEFRKSRSKDFSSWIQNGLVFDIILKGIFISAFIGLVFLLNDSTGFIFTAIGIILLCAVLIIFEFRYLKSSREFDRKDISVQEGIRAKLSFLKTYYYRIQFLQGLSNPIFVAAGVCFYNFKKYGRIKVDDYQDLLVIILILVISFLFTLPTTLTVYGYHYRVLKTSLASLEDEGSWTDAISRYNKQKKIIYWIFGVLLLIGLAVLSYLLLL